MGMAARIIPTQISIILLSKFVNIQPAYNAAITATNIDRLNMIWDKLFLSSNNNFICAQVVAAYVTNVNNAANNAMVLNCFNNVGSTVIIKNALMIKLENSWPRMEVPFRPRANILGKYPSFAAA